MTWNHSDRPSTLSSGDPYRRHHHPAATSPCDHAGRRTTQPGEHRSKRLVMSAVTNTARSSQSFGRRSR